jgi:hypothetical protein
MYSSSLDEALNRAALRGLRIEISGPTGCGKAIALERIKQLIPNADVREVIEAAPLVAHDAQMPLPALSRTLDFPHNATPSAVIAPAKQRAHLNNWFIVGGVAFGDISEHPKLGAMRGCRTSEVVNLDEASGILETRNTVYTLGTKYELLKHGQLVAEGDTSFDAVRPAVDNVA